eukprot:1586381-Ditylum_brightwellii.AAC.1
MATISQQIALDLLKAKFVDDAFTSIQSSGPWYICTCLYSVYGSDVYINFITTPFEKVDKTMQGNIVIEGLSYHVTLQTICDIIAYLKDKEKTKTLPQFALPPPPSPAPSTNVPDTSSLGNVPKTPQQSLLLPHTSPETETENRGVTIASEIAEEGGFGVDDVYHEGKNSIHCR